MTTGEIYHNSVHGEISLSLILNQRQWPFFFCSVNFIAGIHNSLQIYNKEWIRIKSIKVGGINIKLWGGNNQDITSVILLFIFGDGIKSEESDENMVNNFIGSTRKFFVTDIVFIPN